VPAPHIPTPLDQLGHRRFSFYPAIVNIEHNEWLFRRSDWDEIQVMNTKTQEELWIPRRFLGGVSSGEEPVVIVGLVKEIEYREGAIVPLVRRVIEMPRAVNRAVNDVPRPASAAPRLGQLAPVVGIRLENEEHPSKSRGVLPKVAVGLLLCVVGLAIFRDGPFSTRARFFTATPRVPLPFTASDDYLSIVSRIGRPASNSVRMVSDGEIHILRYPDRGYALVVYGPDRDQARYVGAVGRGGRIIHSVTLPDGTDSSLLLSRLTAR
jgi:hypothetical protein